MIYMVDEDWFFPPSINMMERGGSWKPNVEISPACPRCGSSNTKFCYYNNYSLTQPRYFCKGCRRYWTKGGSLRNVPIGGGCRKSRRSHSIKPPPPPIRAPSATLSTDIINNNVGDISPFGLISTTPHRHSPNSTSTTPSSDGPNIDLALVYANFLNPNKPQPPLETHSQHPHHEIIPQLPNDNNSNIIDNNPGQSSFEFSGVQNNSRLELLTATHQQDGCLCHDGNYVVYHPGGLHSIHHRHLFTNNVVNNNNNDLSSNINSNNYVLPPLPDDEIVWPSSISAAEMTLPSPQIVDVNYGSPSSSVVQQQGQNCQRPSNGNGDDLSSLINISNLEDIFKN